MFNFILAQDPCEMDVNSIHLTADGDVLYNTDTDIGGFQFNIDGATFLSAAGGDAGGAGFIVQGSGSTVLAFSFTGSTIPAGCGVLTSMNLDGDATGLSSMVFSDPIGVEFAVTYYVE